METHQVILKATTKAGPAEKPVFCLSLCNKSVRTYGHRHDKYLLSEPSQLRMINEPNGCCAPFILLLFSRSY
jgi:hypothetical protein